MGNSLLRNPTNIGDIFFSGSQTVKKGEQVTWILDETWAFKATEKCGVSTNASPFVTLEGGQTFIIYKRTQADIDAGNTKGIYIFDRDTVVALAYPQEVSQEIIIENENYNEIKNQIDNYNDIQNNIKNNITVDTMSHVIASTGGDQVVKVNYPVTLTGSYTLKAGWTLISRKWHENGVEIGNGGTFTYTPSSVGGHLLYFTVTAEDASHNQSSAQASLTVTAKANAAPNARITGGTDFTVGGSTTMSSYSSSDNDGSIASRKWYVDNVLKSSNTDFTYSTEEAGTYYIKLVVTDNDGATGEDTKRIVVKEGAVLSDIIMDYKWHIKFALLDTAWKRIGTYTATKSATGIVNINSSVSIWSVPTVNKKAYIRVLKGSSIVASGSVSIPSNSNREFIAQCINKYTGSVTKGDVFHVELKDPAGSSTKALAHGSADNQLQIKIINRTS